MKRNGEQTESLRTGFSPAFVQEPEALETSHELSARGLFQMACDSCVGEAKTGIQSRFMVINQHSFAESIGSAPDLRSGLHQYLDLILKRP